MGYRFIWALGLLCMGAFPACSSRKAAAHAVPISSSSYSVSDLREDYAELFAPTVLEPKEGPAAGRKFLALEVQELPEDHPLLGLVQQNTWMLYYLLKHASLVSEPTLFGLMDTPEKLRDEFYSSLEASDQFHELLRTVVDSFLKGQGGELEGFSGRKKPRQLPLADLLKVAARFFYPAGISKSGKFRAHICVGINGLKDYEGERDLLVEAFCYQSIWTELGSPQVGIHDEFITILGEIRKLGLSSDEKTRIARAQGAAWIAMATNPKLKKLLLSNYRERQQILPFVLVLEAT